MGRLKGKSIFCSILCAALIVVCLCFFSAGTSDAEVVQSHTRQYVLPRDALRIITPAVIRDRKLTLRWDLQEYIAGMSRKAKSGLVSVAVIEPKSGEILALYGRDASGENCSLGLNTYQAASLFKVVTATAAVDYAGMTVKTPCSYSGNAHTLYKGQVTDKKSRWSTEVTLAEAFASSNNVIFGKIGALKLGETPLLLTAMRLGFWKSPVIDCECTPSTVFIPENEFNLAELASGYNRYTRVSAVHAAQMVTAVVNDGSMIRPRVMTGSYTYSEQVISKETAGEVRSMMCQTVKNGTVSRAFWDSRTDPVLKGLTIGAKSGSIDGSDPEGSRRWFMGFAENNSTGEAIAIGCLVIRDGKTQINTFDLARGIIRHYFARPQMVASNSLKTAAQAPGTQTARN